MMLQKMTPKLLMLQEPSLFIPWSMGNTFLSSASGQLKSGYLDAFVDLDLVGFYGWGSCAMAYLYKYLSRVTRSRTKSLCRFWPVLQFRCYEYIPASSPVFNDGYFDIQTFPRMAIWNNTQRQNSSAYMRLCLDETTIDSIWATNRSAGRYTPLSSPKKTCFSNASFYEMDGMSREPQLSYEDSVDRGLDFDTYWRTVSLGPLHRTRSSTKNRVLGGPDFACRLLLMGSSSTSTQHASPLDSGHLIPPWDFKVSIFGTSNVISFQGGPFDIQDVVGLPLPDDIPKAYKDFIEYLLRLVDSRERRLKSVVNEMYGIMTKYDNISMESLRQQTRIDFLSEELSTLQMFYESISNDKSGFLRLKPDLDFDVL
ncbi:hypothetical protein C5167_006127 [Papaver somniferum]|uniref:Aminotransferase-like plant mobile domain-containing protein n=1 Tax=Papaver somniferum TaxID=3469 RepID=A0A4Y7JE66_PAPSO|nr:hypothetical protein C5167_006127 [Papaver somniferum]